MKYSRYLSIFLSLLILNVSGYAKAALDSPQATSISGYNQTWIDFGGGYGAVAGILALGGNGSWSYYHPSGLYTLRGVVLIPFPFMEPLSEQSSFEGLQAVEGYYGRIWERKYGYLSAQAGLSFMGIKDGSVKTQFGVGIPIHVQAGFTPLGGMGISFSANFLATNTFPAIMLGVNFEYGILR